MIAGWILTVAGTLLVCIGWARWRSAGRRGGRVARLLAVAGVALLGLGAAAFADTEGVGVALASTTLVAMSGGCVFAFGAPFVRACRASSARPPR